MVALARCPQGHQWQVEPDPAQPEIPNCPNCGLPGDLHVSSHAFAVGEHLPELDAASIPGTRPVALPLEAQQRIDRVCDRFEDAWQKGDSPRIEDYLGEAVALEREALVLQLFLLEASYRRQRDEPIDAADYRSRVALLDPGWVT
jgi:hypothetical protein